jgi:hypothetical protein
MADLASEWGVSSNTVSRRLSFLGIKPIRQGNYRFLTSEQKQIGDELQNHIISGKPMEAFPRPSGESSQIARQVAPQVPKQVARQVELVAALASALQPQADPLSRAKGLAEAADHALVLTTDELVALGVKGVDGFADGDEAYGYAFSKHRQRNRTLWTVERTIGTSNLAGPKAVQSSGPRSVGFAAHISPEANGFNLFAQTTIC